MLGLAILFAAAFALIVAVGTAGTLARLAQPPRLTYGAALARRLPGSPADAGFDFEERTFQLTNGGTTPGWIVRGTSNDADAPILVVSHAWGDSRYSSLPYLQAWAPHARAVVLYDLRGQGESTPRRSALGTTEVDDLVGIVNQLDAGATPIVLLGFSMGVGISIVAATKLGDAVRGVVGEGGYRLGMEPVVGFYRMKRVPLWPFYVFIAGHLAFWYQSDRAFDRAAHAAKLRCPLLLMHGRRDPVCPIRAAREIVAAARGSGVEATLIEFDTDEHVGLAGVDPGRYLDAVAHFFSEIKP